MLIRIFSCIILIFSFSCRNEDTARPNIILINVDDLGWKDVGFMGTDFYETPHIDALSNSGMVFTNGYASASNCAPSRASLMTGKWSPRHGIYTVGSSERGKSQNRRLIPIENTVTLRKDQITIPEILKANGYSTCHAGKWHLSDNPNDRGFDVNIGGGHNGHPASYYPPYKNVNLEPENDENLTDLIMSKTIDYIKSSSSPFFINYAPYAVHTPIQPITRLVNKYENKPHKTGQSNAGYATMIENLDRNIGLLISALKDKGVLDNTLIIFTSDNGGLLGITNQKPLRAGKGSYYEGGIRVPFAFVWNGVIEPSINETPITNIDLFPTLLEVIGFEDEYEYDGQSLLKQLLGQGQGTDAKIRPLFWHFPIYLQAYKNGNTQNRDTLFRTRPGSVIRYGDWKLHHYYEDDGYELYNLEKDIGEERNLVDEYPEKAAELVQLLNEWRKKTNAPVPTRLNPEYVPIDN